MADFEPLLARMVDGLPDQNPETRLAAYDRARAALSHNFSASAQRPTDGEVVAQSSALEGAIARVEARHARAEEVTGPALGDEPTTVTAPLVSPPVDERRRFAFNAAAGGAVNLVKVGIQVVLLPVMARLLGPAEFGLFALALPTVSFFTTLADGGLGVSLAREKEASRSVWSTAFWALLASCTLMAFLTVAGGFVLADVSRQPRLAGIMALLSASFPLLALTALPSARLVRRGNMVVHAVADLVATLTGAILAVSLATFGAGAWALAVQYVAVSTVTCAVLNVAAFERPTFEFHLAALRHHAVTGGSLIGSRLAELFGRQLENLLFGRLFGAGPLGSYTFANQTSRFLCETGGNPVWGALYSHALREDAHEVETLHATLSRLLASVLFSSAALLTASAPQLFDIVLGPRWAGAAVLVQIVVPFYALNAVAAQCGALMLANGRSAVLFWALTGLSACRILAVLIGFVAGPVGIAWGIDVANAAYAATMFAAIGGTTAANGWSLVRKLLPPLAASAVAGSVCLVLIQMRPESLSWTAASLGLGVFVFVVGMMSLQGRRTIADAVAIRRIVFSRL